jgi:type I restriction enzyme S subunit
VVDIQDGRINKADLITTSERISNAYKRTILTAGDLVMPLRGKVGDVALIYNDLAGSNLTRGVALIAVRPTCEAEFCKYYISSASTRSRLEQSLNGSALQEIPIGTLRGFKIALPSSSLEQKAIAEALNNTDALTSSLDQLIAKKRNIIQGAMQELLTGKKRLPNFSGEWKPKRFSEVAKPGKERIDSRRKGVQEFCVELEHIEQGTGRLTDHTSTEESSSLKSVFRKGDVLFGKLRAYLRKYWLANTDGVCSTEIWVLVPNRAVITSEFLFQLVKMDPFVEAASIAYGTHMPRSDWNVVKNYQLRLPSLGEQIAIATILSDLDAEITALEAKLAKVRSLKQGMMQELLTGRIRLV